MKIGVITFWQSKDNYGQILQLFAMQEYLKQKGYYPFVIRYNGVDDTISVSLLKRLTQILVHFPSRVKGYFDRKRELKKTQVYNKSAGYEQRNLQGFILSHLTLSNIYSHRQLINNPPTADAFICGSDIIWGGGDMAYFLDFAPDSSCKIAYAPSCGGMKKYLRENEIKTLLRRFDAIGVREQSGTDLIKSLGREDARKGVDPTLLLNVDDYNKIRETTSRNKPYAFIYLLGNITSCSIEDVMLYVKKQKLDCVYVASQLQCDDYEKSYPTMGEWLDYIAKADVVVTNSFHCTVVSLMFHKPFYTLALGGEMKQKNTRVEELLKESNLLSRLIEENILETEYNDLSFNSFDAYRIRQELLSYSFLTAAISKHNQ